MKLSTYMYIESPLTSGRQSYYQRIDRSAVFSIHVARAELQTCHTYVFWGGFFPSPRVFFLSLESISIN